MLSGTTLSIFIDGRMIEHNLSELIVRGLDTRYPDLMAKVRPGVKAKLKAGWEKNMSYVVKVLRLIKRRVFVVLDEVDCLFKRPEQKHVLRELLQLGEDSKDVLVYLAAAGTRTRVLVTGNLPAAEHAQFVSYTGVSLNHTKYRLLIQRARSSPARASRMPFGSSAAPAAAKAKVPAAGGEAGAAPAAEAVAKAAKAAVRVTWAAPSMTTRVSRSSTSATLGAFPHSLGTSRLTRRESRCKRRRGGAARGTAWTSSGRR